VAYQAQKQDRAGTSTAEAAAVFKATFDRGRLLPVWDVAAIVVVFLITLPAADLSIAPTGAQFPGQQSSAGMAPFEAPALMFAAIATVGLLLLRGRRPELGGRLTTLPSLAAVSAITAWLVLIGSAAAHLTIDLDQLVLVSLCLPCVWLLGRVILSPAGPPRRVLLVGSGRVAAHIGALCARNPGGKLEVIGCIDDDPLPLAEDAPLLLGSLGDLPRILAGGGVDRVVVCFSHSGDREISDLLRACDEQQVEVDMVPRMFDLVGPSPRSGSICGFPLVSLTGGGTRGAQGIAKRGFDIVCAGSVLILMLPILFAISIAIVLDTPGGVFYRSCRLGRGGREFRMLKFRTMFEDADTREDAAVAGLIKGELKACNDVRITRVGRFLRRASLDELPQLLNVLTGSMSLVGPRPVLATEAAGVEGWANKRHTVRPGVTGLWQVLGRSTIPWDERMQLDYSYARHWSLIFDLKILVATVSAVVSRRGAF